jgi:hypothetical protein
MLRCGVDRALLFVIPWDLTAALDDPFLKQAMSARFVQFVRSAKKFAGAFGFSRAWLQSARPWSGLGDNDSKFAAR